jgi:quercetin dioxygenase-like cupin family protein
MTMHTMYALRTAMTVAIALCAAAAWAQPPAATVTPLLTQPLQGIAGKEGAIVTVELSPGADSQPHRHNANTFVYVLEGSVVMQVEGGEERTLRRGETFYEKPTDVHTVSRNPSATEAARLLVFFVKDVGAPMTVPAR